ncbi:hypothetical protein BDR22DRAFT_818752 [Usnea florida]
MRLETLVQRLLLLPSPSSFRLALKNVGARQLNKRESYIHYLLLLLLPPPSARLQEACQGKSPYIVDDGTGPPIIQTWHKGIMACWENRGLMGFNEGIFLNQNTVANRKVLSLAGLSIKLKNIAEAPPTIMARPNFPPTKERHAIAGTGHSNKVQAIVSRSKAQVEFKGKSTGLRPVDLGFDGALGSRADA